MCLGEEASTFRCEEPGVEPGGVADDALWEEPGARGGALVHSTPPTPHAYVVIYGINDRNSFHYAVDVLYRYYNPSALRYE